MPGSPNPLNAVKGQAYVYWAPFGSTEPAQTNAALIEDPSAPWTFLGSTDKSGITWEDDDTVTDTMASQVIDPIGGRVTGRKITITMSLLEPTLARLALVLNSFGTVTTETGITVFDPGQPAAGSIPQYSALLIDGQAPQLPGGGQARRRAIFRKCMNDAKVKTEGDPTKDQVYAVSMKCYFVSSGISPYVVMDQTA